MLDIGNIHWLVGYIGRLVTLVGWLHWSVGYIGRLVYVKLFILLPNTRSSFVHCCIDQRSTVDKYQISYMELVHVVLNIGCHWTPRPAAFQYRQYFWQCQSYSGCYLYKNQCQC